MTSRFYPWPLKSNCEQATSSHWSFSSFCEWSYDKAWVFNQIAISPISTCSSFRCLSWDLVSSSDFTALVAYLSAWSNQAAKIKVSLLLLNEMFAFSIFSRFTCSQRLIQRLYLLSEGGPASDNETCRQIY